MAQNHSNRAKMTESLTDVTTLVVPVAGYGTRSLPFTKALPKVMLPLVDKPGIQCVVEEAVTAGISEVIFITSSNQHSIEDHFDYYYELEEKLKESGKTDMLKEIRRVSDLAHFSYTRQKEPLGNAHAILQAKPLVGDQTFCVEWGDDIIFNPNGETALGQLKTLYSQTDADVILGTIETDDAGTSKYAIIETESEGDFQRVISITEKPGPETTTSRLASVGFYILKPKIFHYIESLNPDEGAGGEYVLADAVKAWIKDGARVYSQTLQGERIDIGNKLNYMQGAVGLALKHPEIGDDFRAWLKELKL